MRLLRMTTCSALFDQYYSLHDAVTSSWVDAALNTSGNNSQPLGTTGWDVRAEFVRVQVETQLRTPKQATEGAQP